MPGALGNGGLDFGLKGVKPLLLAAPFHRLSPLFWGVYCDTRRVTMFFLLCPGGRCLSHADDGCWWVWGCFADGVVPDPRRQGRLIVGDARAALMVPLFIYVGVEQGFIFGIFGK